MAGLQIFKNSEFGEVRTIQIDGEPWFVGKDVAEILGYAKPLNALSTHIDEDDSLKWGLTDSLGRKQQTIIINESGLYSLILGSKLPKAKEFKRWVTREVIPTLRKTGSYSLEIKPDSYTIEDPAARARRWAEEYEERKALENRLEEQKPLVDFAAQVSDTTDVVDISALSKLLRKQGLNIGRNKLFEWLRENKYLRPNNEPYQRYINEGYFKTKESTYFVGNEPKITIKTFVTGKGQQYIFDKLSSVNMK